MEKSGSPIPPPRHPVTANTKQPSSTEQANAAKFQTALALHQQGQIELATILYKEILQSEPEHFDALQLSATIAAQQKNSAVALEMFDRALKIRPDYAEVLNNRGSALFELNRPEEALDSYNRALEIKPDYAQALVNRGSALLELKRPEEALDSYDRALKIKPADAGALGSRGNVLRNLKRYAEALDSYDHALKIKPDYVEVLYSRGCVLLDLERYEEALDSYDRALKIKPDFAEALNSRGNALRNLKRIKEAIDSYERALKIKPDYAAAHGNEGLCRLLLGDFAVGWQKNEWRWKTEHGISFMRQFTHPMWLGEEPLQGKTILLYSEQGLGDTLQFCRYAKPVSDLGARVILHVQPPLVDLLRNLEGVVTVLTTGDALPAFDYHCPLMSLPLAFKTRLDTIPAPNSYIKSSAARTAQWQVKLGHRSKPRVGLVWSGSSTHPNNNNRSVVLAELIEFLPAGFQYVSLQKEVRNSDHETLQAHPGILHFGEELKELADTAALCELVDLVVSVDTSVAHLAGSMGKSVWILLPYVPDFRWLLARSDSPWYPSARLYRQERAGDWGGLLERVAADLRTQVLIS